MCVCVYICNACDGDHICMSQVDCPLDQAMTRVCARHVAAGICADIASAQVRVDTNDRVNGTWILENRLPATWTVSTK